MRDALISTNSARAEIIWILKCVMNGYSIRSNDDLFEMFSAMFPEFKSVKLFSMARTKSMYVINHGIAPYFKSLLKADIEKSDMFSFSFDESLNEATQTSEMDLYIRFWDVNLNKVSFRYFGSTFLGHGTHQDLLIHFQEVTKEINYSHLYQVSMDGPSINLKFYQEFSTCFKENNSHSLLDIGSCSLHVVHRSFTTGVEKSGWKWKNLLKGAYYVLHNTAARTEDYESTTWSTVYPLKFCSTR